MICNPDGVYRGGSFVSAFFCFVLFFCDGRFRCVRRGGEGKGRGGRRGNRAECWRRTCSLHHSYTAYRISINMQPPARARERALSKQGATKHHYPSGRLQQSADATPSACTCTRTHPPPRICIYPPLLARPPRRTRRALCPPRRPLPPPPPRSVYALVIVWRPPPPFLPPSGAARKSERAATLQRCTIVICMYSTLVCWYARLCGGYDARYLRCTKAKEKS